MEALFGKTINMLADSLDYRVKRHKVLASNIANLDTPEYEPKDLTFENTLNGAMGGKLPLAKTDKRHIAAGSGLKDCELVKTGDRVNLDKEMIAVAENNLMNNLSVELLVRKFKALNNVLR
jgi:flagellar basal-body rod protein FlgB